MKIVIPNEYRHLFSEDIMSLEEIFEIIEELNRQIDILLEREED